MQDAPEEGAKDYIYLLRAEVCSVSETGWLISL